jgi:hypothetical protein
VVVVWPGGHRNYAGDDEGGDPYGGDVEDGESAHGVRRGYARSVAGVQGNEMTRVGRQMQALRRGWALAGGEVALP